MPDDLLAGAEAERVALPVLRGGEALAELARRPVLRVGIEVVDEEQESAALVGADPGQRRIRRRVRAAEVLVVLVRARVDLLEPADDAEGTRQEVDVDDRGRRVARVAELFLEGGDVARQASEIADASARSVLGGILGGEQRREGGQRPRSRGERVLEGRTVRSPRVEARGQRAGVAARADAIRAQRVDADEEDVRALGLPSALRPGCGSVGPQAGTRTRRERIRASRPTDCARSPAGSPLRLNARRKMTESPSE